MGPLGACSCRLHGATLLGTQKALGADAEDARPAQPVPQRHFDDAVTGLRNTSGMSFDDSSCFSCTLWDVGAIEHRE